jgi:hypothetical protein
MVTIDEYIEELKKKLVDPEPYKFEGTYEYLGNVNTHYGRILIDKINNNSRQFVGEIRDPTSHICIRLSVIGGDRFEETFKKIRKFTESIMWR